MKVDSAATILLVEDDEPTRQSIAMFLRGYRHDVVEAGDVATATEAWERQRPDLIVLDLGLPDDDGLVADPAPATRGDDPDPRPVGTRPGGGQGRGARPRRRRLRDQAVRHGRAAGPDRRPPAPGGRAGRGSDRDVQVGDLQMDVGRRLVTVNGTTGPPHAHASTRSSRSCSRTGVSWSPTAACCGRCGGPPTATRRTTSTSTSARSDARSRPPDAGRDRSPA